MIRRVLLDSRRGSRITHCANENPGVPTVPTGIQEYPLCRPGSRVPPKGIQEYPSTQRGSEIRIEIVLLGQRPPRYTGVARSWSIAEAISWEMRDR